MFLAIVITCMLFSCDFGIKEASNENYQYSKIQVSEINKDIKYSSLIDEIKYIPLEVKDSSKIIGEISKILFADNKFFVLDKIHLKTISVFDKDGKFINNIGSLGEGAGEYTKIDDFFIDDKNNEVGVLSINRIIVFSIDGKFKREKKLNFMATHIEKGVDFFAFEGVEYNLLKTDVDFNIKTVEFPFSSIYDLHILNPFNTMSQDILYRHSMSDTIYQITNTTTKPHYIIDFGNKALSGELLQKVIKKEANVPEDKMHSIKYYFENKDFIYFNFLYRKMYHTCLYNKASKLSKTFPINIENDVTLEEFIPLINGSTDTHFIGVILEESVTIKSLDRSNPYISSILEIYAKRDLKNKAYNPVLVLIKFKSM